MKTITALPLAAAAALGLAACSNNAKNESAEAANAIATDVGNTVDAGVNSVDNALDAAGNTMDNAAHDAANATHDAANAAGNAANSVSNAANAAGH